MPQIDKELTIARLIENFIIDRRVRGVSANTARYYRDELTVFTRIVAARGITTLDQLTTDVLRAAFLELATYRNKGGVHSVFRSVRTMLNWWEKESGGEYRNPIDNIEIKPAKVKPLPGVSIADIQRMIDCCDTGMGQRNKTMLLCLLDTGARAFEFCALDVGDVDLISGAVKINHGKGDKERTVYIGRVCRREIRRYLKGRTKLNPSAPLWLNEDGERLEKRGLRAVIEFQAARAGIHTPGLHDFRRAFALNMWRNGVDLLTISRLMGHSTIEMTKRYIGNDPGDLRIGHQSGSPVDHM